MVQFPMKIVGKKGPRTSWRFTEILLTYFPDERLCQLYFATGVITCFTITIPQQGAKQQKQQIKAHTKILGMSNCSQLRLEIYLHLSPFLSMLSF